MERLVGDTGHLNARREGLYQRLAVLQEHRHHLFKILIQFVQRRRLRMGAGKVRNVTNKEIRLRAMFDDCGVGSHSALKGKRLRRCVNERLEPEYSRDY